jgi:hypothetical protein
MWFIVGRPLILHIIINSPRLLLQFPSNGTLGINLYEHGGANPVWIINALNFKIDCPCIHLI